MREDVIRKEAEVYLESSTLKEAAFKCGISVRSLQLHLKKLEEIDLEMHRLVISKSKSNVIEGRIKGGSLGKRSVTYTKDQAIMIAEYMIKNQSTYQEIEDKFGIPSSTVYEMVHSPFISEGLKMQLDLVASMNRHFKVVEDYKKL